MWYCVLYCEMFQLSALLPTLFEKAPLQYWCTILLLPATIICAWKRMPFSGSPAFFPLRRGAGLFGTVYPEPSSAQQAFLLDSLQWSSYQPPPAASQRPHAPMTVQHHYSCGIFDVFFPLGSLLDTCSSQNLFWFMFFSLYFSSGSPPLPQWLSLSNTPFSPSWASFVGSQTKALHHCPC